MFKTAPLIQGVGFICARGHKEIPETLDGMFAMQTFAQWVTLRELFGVVVLAVAIVIAGVIGQQSGFAAAGSVLIITLGFLKRVCRFQTQVAVKVMFWGVIFGLTALWGAYIFSLF